MKRNDRNHRLSSACASLFESLETRVLYAVYDVTSSADSGPGTLRAAITKSNASVNVRDTIEFHIPESPGSHVTITPKTKLPTITDPVTIDGGTQSGSQTDDPRVQISGNECSTPFANGLVIATKNTLVIGLGIDRFDKGAGIRIVGNSNGVHECFLGIRALNSERMPNKWGVNIVDGSGNVIGKNGAYQGNVISGNLSNGVQITGISSNNTIKGNLIGTSSFGTQKVANNANGVMVGIGVTGNFIVGNTISGNKQNGVLISGGHYTTVKSNNIGVDPSEKFLPNQGNGIRVDAGGSHNTLGIVGGGNKIIWNNEDGISIAGGSHNSIHGNEMRDNKQLGIDLGNDGVTTNDDGDGDSGANGLQNYPVITSASWNGQNTVVIGDFKGRPNSTYSYDFYANRVRDASGFGEGTDYIVTFPSTTDAAGNGHINFTTAGDYPNSYLTATLTDPDGSTSEFSPTFHVENKKPGVPKMGIKDATVIETNGSQVLSINVTLSAPLNVPLNYLWNPYEGTAKRGDDYSFSDSSFFEAGETQDTINIQIEGDVIPEMLKENFFIYLTPYQPELVNITKFKSIVTIIDDDNTLPVALNDVVDVNYNTPKTIDVLANDHDAEGEALKINSVDNPAHGTAEIINGKIKYTPDSDFIGFETFKYRVNDPRGGGDVAKVIVHVIPPSHIDIVASPGNPGVLDLKVTGGGGGDQIKITKVGVPQGKVKVQLNGTTKGTFSFSGKIIVDGLGDDDKITVDHAITRTAWLIGGPGKDTLGGGGGNDALFSDDGERDELDGGPGVDLLFKDALDVNTVIV